MRSAATSSSSQTVSEDFHCVAAASHWTAHGATYHAAPNVFRELGAQVELIGDAPDGLNINLDCGSTAPAALQRRVLESGVELGIAFDGDGDRVQMIDARGHLVDGDDILYILAVAWQRQGLLTGPVVGTQMTTSTWSRRCRRVASASSGPMWATAS